MSKETELQDAITSLRHAISSILHTMKVVEAWAEMVEKKHCPPPEHPAWGDKVATERF